MLKFFNSSIGRLRAITFIEGLSLIVLVFVAMPLKYIWHQPQAVKMVGSIHGALFIAYILCLVFTQHIGKWAFKNWLYFIALSFIPFGTFYLDAKFFKHLHK